jgi:uncharacterized repeat protein (TIGR01451 family)
MKKKPFYALTLLFCFLLATLHGHAAYAAADIQPSSFLDNIDPVPARGEVTYSVVVKSNDPANPVTNAVLDIPLPAGFTFVSVSDAGCSYSGSVPSSGGSDKIHCGWTTITTQKNVDFHVLAPDTTNIYTLTATTSADVDSNTGNNSEIVTTQVVTSADLQLTSKTGTPNPAPGGSIVTYAFTVTNNGPYQASALTLTDTLPTGLTFVADNANPAANQDSDWSCSAAGQVVTCTAASLAVSATPSVFHFRVQVTKATTGAITNAASVSASTPDPKPDNNTATHNLTVIDGTDMAIAKSVATNPVIGGQPAQFTLTATNNGPMSAANVVVRDTLPSGYTGISMISTPAGWNCAIDDISDPPVITCSIASIAAGASSVFTISATPPATAAIVTHQNSAQVATTTTDPIGSNDNVTVSYDVNPDIADLSISKTKSPDPVAQGSDITSTIVVHNNGPRPADPVQVVDVLSGGETYVSYSGTNWSCTHNGVNPGGTVTCSYSAVPLANGANTATLTIITTATNAGVLTNTACTGGDGGSAAPGYGDTNTGNNCANGSVTSTTEQADLVVTKSTSDPDIDPTENSFTYTVTIHNNGPQTAGAIDFRDIIPQYVSAGSGGRPATGLTATPDNGSSCTITNALIQCNLGDIASGATVTIPITVTRPMRDGTLTNTASAYSTLTGDPVRSNNVASVDVTVQPVTDIEVTDKSVTYAEAPDPILAGTIATYTIQVRNNGPSTAQTVTLADVFSGEAFDFIDSSVAGGGSCTYDSPSTTLNCALENMAASTTKAITVRIRPDHFVTPVGAWQIDNTATVSMATTDSNPANNSQTEILPIVLGVADLAITKNESSSFTEPVRYNPSGTNLIVYKIDIANSGPSLATGVFFTDKVSSVTPANGQELTFVRDTANSDGSADGTSICDTTGTTFTVGGSAPTITCTLASDAATNGGQLASGSSYTRYLVFQVLTAPDAVSGDSYHDEATVNAHEEEPTPANNTENENTTVRTIADLGLVKTASKTPVEVEESFSYTLTVTNHGPGKSPETTVSDTLPSGMILTGAPTPSVGSCTGIAGNTSFTCALGLMDSGASATISVPVKVTTWSTPKHNCASVSSLAPEPDPDTTNPNTGCVDVVVSQPATLGDFVWLDRNANGIQNSEPGISGVTVNLLDSSFNQVATTTTNGSGIYSFTINHADTYHVEFVKPTGYFPSPKDVVGTEATDSDADTANGRTDAIVVAYGAAITTVDAGFYQQVSLGNRVWHDSDADGVQDAAELGIPGVTVELLNSSLVVIATTTTDASGLYSFTGLTPGDYSVQITPPAWVGYLPSPVQTADPDNNSNTDSNIASTPVTGTFRSGVITLSSRQEPTTDGDSDTNTNLSLDLGIVLPGSVGNRVWLDEDSNGRQDAGEPGLANVTMELRSSTGTLIATTTTDANGGYLFSGIAPGAYFVKVLATSLANGLSQTTTYSTTATDFGNQNQSPANGYSVHVTSGGENLTADFGYNWSPTGDVTGGTNTGAIGDRVWIDHDGNGIQDAGEIGVSGVAVTLYSLGPDGLLWTVDDVTTATTATDASGNYIFDNLAAGAYAVEITASGAASHDILNSSSYNQTGDPDHFAANLATAPAGTAGDHRSSRPIILGPGDTFINADFGYQPTGSTLHTIGDTVWLDLNRDGILNAPSETGIQGVVIGLKNAGGEFIATTTTNTNGQYLFTDLPDGNYTVVVIDSENVLAGLSQTYDADTPTSLDGQSALTLSGSDNLDQDFGYTPISAEAGTGAIGDTIFLDRNANNTFDSGEGMEGVRVFLKNGSGIVIAAAFTDESGRYYFSGLDAGTYTVEVDTTTLPTGITNSVDPNGDNNSTSTLILGAGAINLLQDFGYVAAAPGSIGNLVWKDINADGIYDADGPDNSPGTADDETGLAGVGMSLFRDLNNNNLLDANEPLLSTTTTDSNGGYLFAGMPAGEYIVRVSDPANRLEGFWHSLGNTGLNNNSQTDYYPVSLSAGDAYLAADFGYYHQPGSVGNRVWKDVNVNGLFESGDTGLADITVFLDITYPNGTTVTVQTLTDSDGYYTFSNLLLDENHNGISASTYGNGGDEPSHTVRIDSASVPTGLASIYPTRVRNTDSLTVGGASADDEGSDNGGDSPVGEPGYPPMGGNDPTNDFGYFEPGSIGDTVWNDANNNGLVEAGEGLIGVTVRLTPPVGVNLGAGVGVAVTTTTDASGNYLFTDLPPGSYTVTVVESTLPAVLQGHNTVDPNGGNDSTSTLTLAINEDNLSQDFGYFVSCAIGNFVWDDSNGNGIQDSGESGHQGISVHLLNGSGALVDVLLTGSNGEYLFTGLIPGDYQVQFVLPTNNSFTLQNNGGNDSVDSDPASTGLVSVTLGASESNTTIDAGLVGAGIHLEKATNGSDADTAPGPSLEIGVPVSWTYEVSNTGSVPLTAVAVTDNKGVTVTCPKTTLAAGESMNCTGSGTAVAGQYENIGTAIGTPPSGPAVVDTDPSHYLAGSATSAAIDIEKYTNGEDADTAPGPVIAVGDPVIWTYVVTNIGNVNLTGITVSDNQGVSLTCTETNLTIGESMNCTGSGTAVAGQYSNIGSVTGNPEGGGSQVSDADPSHYFGSDAGDNYAALDLEKATNGEDADTAPGPYIETGHAIIWSYVVTNTGNVDLHNVTITDDQLDSSAIHCPNDGNTDNRITLLPVGAHATCTATGTAVAGQYANTGSTVGSPEKGPNVSDTDPSHYYGDDGTIDIEKATNGHDADDAPGPYITINRDVTWTYVVTNTGQFPLTDVSVTDDKHVVVTCPKNTLAADEIMTCTGTGKAVKGQYENIGSVTAKTPDNKDVQDTDPSHYFGKSSLLLFLPPIIRPQCPPVPDYCYVVADGDNDNSTNSPLFKYVFKNNSLELLNRLGVDNVEAIVLSEDGKTLYGAENGVFGIINPTPGVNNSFTPLNPSGIGQGRGSLGTVPLDDIDGLSFDPTNGVLYGTVRRGEGSDNKLDLLIQIDPWTGTLVRNAFGANVDYVVLSTSSVNNYDVDDIAIDTNGIMYGIGGNSSGGGGDKLLIINKQTGTVQHYGTLSNQGSPVQDMEGLTLYNNNVLYGSTGMEFSGTANTLYRIEKQTGETTPVNQLDQNINGYIPTDFEAISCFPICR